MNRASSSTLRLSSSSRPSTRSRCYRSSSTRSCFLKRSSARGGGLLPRRSSAPSSLPPSLVRGQGRALRLALPARARSARLARRGTRRAPGRAAVLARRRSTVAAARRRSCRTSAAAPLATERPRRAGRTAVPSRPASRAARRSRRPSAAAPAPGGPPRAPPRHRSQATTPVPRHSCEHAIVKVKIPFDRFAVTSQYVVIASPGSPDLGKIHRDHASEH